MQMQTDNELVRKMSLSKKLSLDLWSQKEEEETPDAENMKVNSTKLMKE